jgi:PII-like signaling protein
VVEIENQSEKDQELMRNIIEMQVEKLKRGAEAYRSLAKSFDKEGFGNLGHKHRVMVMAMDIMIELLEGEEE